MRAAVGARDAHKCTTSKATSKEACFAQNIDDKPALQLGSKATTATASLAYIRAPMPPTTMSPEARNLPLSFPFRVLERHCPHVGVSTKFHLLAARYLGTSHCTVLFSSAQTLWLRGITVNFDLSNVLCWALCCHMTRLNVWRRLSNNARLDRFDERGRA